MDDERTPHRVRMTVSFEVEVTIEAESPEYARQLAQAHMTGHLLGWPVESLAIESEVEA